MYADLADYYNVFQHKTRRAKGEAVRSVFRNINKEKYEVKMYEPKEQERKVVVEKLQPKNILIVPDLHEPFALPDAIEFCQKQYEKWQCEHVIFIGDILDNHFSSYHVIDPDGLSAVDELELAKERIAKWYSVFPRADVLSSNHDNIIARKFTSSGLSSKWMRSFNEVFDTPGWNFVDEVEYNGVMYRHGEGGEARTYIKSAHQSVVSGHYHTKNYIEYNQTNQGKIFAMQVGTLIDRETYAMAYAKNYARQALSCAVVLDNGQLPVLIPYNHAIQRTEQVQEHSTLRKRTPVSEPGNKKISTERNDIDSQIRTAIREELLAALQSLSKSGI